MSQSKVTSFKVGDSVVYPSHGVGHIAGEEAQVIAGIEVKLYVITFDKDRMILRVPKNRAEKAGLRHLSSTSDFDQALTILKGKARVAKGMWSKRAQEYELKINSGSITSIAEVLRDLHPNVEDPNRSYSERLIYESAMERLANEFANTNTLDLETAGKQIREILDTSRLLHKSAA